LTTGKARKPGSLSNRSLSSSGVVEVEEVWKESRECEQGREGRKEGKRGKGEKGRENRRERERVPSVTFDMGRGRQGKRVAASYFASKRVAAPYFTGITHRANAPSCFTD
jgi:hypothetical protein